MCKRHDPMAKIKTLLGNCVQYVESVSQLLDNQAENHCTVSHSYGVASMYTCTVYIHAYFSLPLCSQGLTKRGCTTCTHALFFLSIDPCSALKVGCMYL